LLPSHAGMHDNTVRPVTATYRLQLNKDFTLHDARAKLPYLESLGISHLYCSPVLAARTGSMHGYDVADPTHVGAELGGDEAFRALADAAHARRMGIILDIVPNHMGIGPDNPFWEDVLAHGASSQYAAWFDVEWRATRRKLAGKVLLPVLGDTIENVMSRDELVLEASDRGVRVRYFDHHFPLDPTSLPPELELAQRDPSAREVLATWTKGDDGRARLASLLAAQHYELAFWRTASRDLNYRRFFDVNELIALRVERQEVFDATHRVVLQMVADGLLDGLRIDHVDGLLEPRRYLERLRAAVDARQPRAEGAPRFPILVEKILAPGETLPREWPVDGTTGYEFMVTLEDVFVDPAGYERLEARYRSGDEQPAFHAIAVEAKRRVLRSALNADVRRIAPMLSAVARGAGWPARSIGAYAMAIVELVAVLPVYRTYIDAGHVEPRPADRAVLEAAFAAVRERGRADAGAVDALELTLLGRWGAPDVKPAVARARLAFVLRWQQLTGPAAAKGVEDTALYMYAPLASRNEVGGDPGVPVAGAMSRLHVLLQERVAHGPRSLNATNTHDTKRSADVRNRLDALSEHAGSWERRLAQWRRHHRALRTLVGGKLAPTRTTDNFIYQSLVGIWPVDRAPSRDGDPRDDERLLGELCTRLTAYIHKAVREAKVSTSWTDPDVEYEEAISRFISGLLNRRSSAAFLREVEQFADEIQPQGIWNALSRIAIHLTAPGIPDLYQGDELWFQALVDPDNRRPVDWEARTRVLDAVQGTLTSHGVAPGEALSAMMREPADGRLKMYLTRRLLQFRRDSAPIVSRGGYRIVTSSGEHAEGVVAYERVLDPDAILVVAPRLTAGLGEGPPIGDVWGDTALAVQNGGVWRCLLTGTEVRVQQGLLPMRELLAILPVAVLARVH
jgi:(1->4)-alpha-D-glucan 1-alpha-D-glucosylmutase